MAMRLKLKFRSRKIQKRLDSSGSFIESQYVLFVNNVDPLYFNSRQELMLYLDEFRSHTSIFKLQMFRVDTYSL